MKANRKKGFSMIELIVVLAIIGLFTALSSIGFGYLKAGNVKSAAKTVDSTLSKLKLDTMSKDETPYMCIYRDGNDYYMFCTTDISGSSSNAERIGNDNVKISVNGNPIGANGKVYVAFKKGSGTFTEKVESTITTIHSGVSGEATISVESADGKGTSYVIHLIKDTGKHYIEIK